MRLLFIRFSSIGDIVLTTPVIRCAKQQIPGVEIHFLTKLSMKEVTEANPYIDHFHYLDKDINEIIPSLKQQMFDAVIDLHHNQRTWRIKRALGVKSFSYKKLSIQKIILTTFGIDLLKKQHVTKRYLETLQSFGVVDDGKGLDYFIPNHTISVLNDLPEIFKSGYVGLVIGASYFNKKMPLEKLTDLIESIQSPIVLIGGPDDQKVAKALQAAFANRVFNACGEYSINESAMFVKHAQFIVAHDTGFLHVACAFNKPTVTIWGATTPALQFSALYPASSTVPRFDAIVPNLKCQPCAKQGANHCPKKHFNCMQLQNTNLIAAKVNANSINSIRA
jgi:ADP-heptose:LPS heptosyltransferase